MSQDHSESASLVADPPAPARNSGGRLYGWVVAIICLCAAAALAVLPYAAEPGPELPSITAFFVAGLLVTELSTSFLLFLWFGELRGWSVLVLGCAYLFSGLMSIGYLVAFPGAVLPGRPVIGEPQSTAWIFDLWFTLYAALTLAAILLEAFAGDRRIAPDHVRHAVGLGIAAALALVAGCAVVAFVAVDRMPALLQGTSWTNLNDAVTDLALAMMALGVALVLLVIRGRSKLFLWLGVAVAVTFFVQILTLFGGGRYTVGWSIGRLSWLVSSCILFLFLMRQFGRQQQALARAKATLQQSVEARTSALTRTVRQRDLLLREVYHRVKNNLQVMDALIVLESRAVADPVAREALAELRNRVFALALVHQQLMSSDSLESFSIAPFLAELADNVAASYGASDSGIAIGVTADPVTVNLDFAIPVGLIATELLSNALKHAGATTVSVAFRRDRRDHAVLTVSDDGEAASARPAGRAGIGSRIVDGFIKQLEGRMAVFRDKGTRVEVEMPLPQAMG